MFLTTPELSTALRRSPPVLLSQNSGLPRRDSAGNPQRYRWSDVFGFSVQFLPNLTQLKVDGMTAVNQLPLPVSQLSGVRQPMVRRWMIGIR